MQWLPPSRPGFRQAGHYLLNMRLAIVAIQLVAMAVAEYMLTLSYQTEALVLVIAYGIIATLGWLWFNRYPPQSSAMVSLGLTLDLVLIGGWVFLTAGYTNPRGTWAANDYYYEHDVVVAPDGNGYRCYWEHASAIAWDDDRMFWRLYVQGAAASTGFGKRHGPLVDAGPIDRNDIVFTGETDNLMITDLGQGGGVFDLGGVA